jgi:hypothetical protein
LVLAIQLPKAAKVEILPHKLSHDKRLQTLRGVKAVKVAKAVKVMKTVKAAKVVKAAKAINVLH